MEKISVLMNCYNSESYLKKAIDSVYSQTYDNWEIIFKSGLSAPAYLPGHSHSDIGTFDIFYKGKPIIVETGTSRYENSFIRDYERSGIAHNIIQFTDFFDAIFSQFLQLINHLIDRGVILFHMLIICLDSTIFSEFFDFSLFFT